MEDTIFAKISGEGKGSVALFRISGKEAFSALEEIGISTIPRHSVSTLKRIYTHKDRKEIIDKVLITCFYSPKSFTGENVVEISTHASSVIEEILIKTIVSIPFIRIAEPGEFTKRAFFNGKIDLAAAESIKDVIEAQTKMQHKQAIRNLDNKTGNLYTKWTDKIIQMLAFMEANIDFPEEETHIIFDSINREASHIINEIVDIINNKNSGEKLRNGIHIGIFGNTNVGKSSLINILAKKEISIVTDIPGTTRDMIKTQIDLAGYPVVITDTAGIRNATEDTIEKIGIKKAQKLMHDCDIKIIVIDAVNDTEQNLISDALDTTNTIIVMNKADLLTKKDLIHTNQNDNKNTIFISCKDAFGINILINAIEKLCKELISPNTNATITRAWHEQYLNDALHHLNNSIEQTDVILKAEEIKLALNNINCITGKKIDNEILDQIFSKFCIGK